MEKHLLIIESNTTGTGLIALEIALSLGLSPIFLTNNPNRYKGLERIKCPVIVCNTNSIDALIQTITAHKNVNQILGITTTSEFYVETVAHLTTYYGLAGNTAKAIQSCRNKAQTRRLLEAAQIRQPNFAVVCSISELNSAFTRIGFPCVVKPADDTGSSEVRICQTREEVEAQVTRILAISTNVRGQDTAQTVLIEEFLDVPEFSVEMFSWQGETTCVGITQKYLTGLPYFIEYRHIFPANLSQHIAEEIQATVKRTLDVVGITHGATHTEVKLTPQGAAIIEINARLAGGMIPELIRYATGINLLEQQLKSAVGLSPDLQFRHTSHAGIQFIVAHTEGTLKDVRGIEAIQQEIEGIERVTITTPLGNRVALPRSAYDRLGYIVTRADTYEEAVLRLNKALAKLKISIES